MCHINVEAIMVINMTLSEQGGGGGGSENYPLCLNPIFDFLNMTFKHKLYINMVKF